MKRSQIWTRCGLVWSDTLKTLNVFNGRTHCVQILAACTCADDQFVPFYCVDGGLWCELNASVLSEILDLRYLFCDEVADDFEALHRVADVLWVAFNNREAAFTGVDACLRECIALARAAAEERCLPRWFSYDRNKRTMVESARAEQLTRCLPGAEGFAVDCDGVLWGIGTTRTKAVTEAFKTYTTLCPDNECTITSFRKTLKKRTAIVGSHKLLLYPVKRRLTLIL